ncbi:hypothetical protein ACFL6Y_11130 [Elusimicrobiota bacterium]
MKNSILSKIPTSEAPFLMRQVEEYRREGLSGYTIVNNTPLTMSAIVKMMPFLKNGFKLTTSTPSFLGRDQNAIKLIQEMGYEFNANKERMDDVDIILDCCAEMSENRSAKAIAELTKTGVAIYKNKGDKRSVLSVDDCRVKALETFYGTGDGFVRAFKEFIAKDISGVKFLIFGFGKVGKGIVRALLDQSAICTVIEADETAFRADIGKDIKKVFFSEIASISSLLKDHDILITCTGKSNFMSDAPWADEILKSKIKLINMGAEDEFGPKFPKEAVENDKMPLNFKLSHPTLLKYLDPVFYAHNSIVALYHDNNLTQGVQPLPKDLDNHLVEEWHSIWGADMSLFSSLYPES